MAKMPTEEPAVSPTIKQQLAAMGRKRNSLRLAEAKATALKHELDALSHTLLASMKAEGLESASSTTLIASRTTQEVAKITDYGKLRDWVIKNKALDLFQNRLSITAIRERREAGESIAGISTEKLAKLSLRAKSKK